MQTQLKEKYNLCAHAAKMSFYFLFSCIHFYTPFYSLKRHSFKRLLKVNPKMLTFCSLLLPYHGDFLKYELCPHAPMLLISICSKVFTLALSTFPTINGQIKPFQIATLSSKLCVNSLKIKIHKKNSY